MTTVQLLLCGHTCQLRNIFVNFDLRLQPIRLITDTVIFLTHYINEWNDYYV